MVRLIGNFHVISGDKLTHPWDASAYLIAGAEPVLIDCGSTEGYEAMKRNLKLAGYEPGQIRRVFATHGHWDHLSAAAFLKAESDVKLYIHEAERGVIGSGDEDRTAAFLYGKPFPPVKADELIHDGDVFEVCGTWLRALHTPGHTPGSVSFLIEVGGLKILIGGDTLWGGYHQRIHSNMDDWMASMEKLIKLDFDVATIGHCPPTLIFDAKTKVLEAAEQLGIYYNPWFKPFNKSFKY
jgi:hydroxyacylglutathione hydrolase